MGKKLTFLAGVGVGYVLGARAGRERYESLKSAAIRVRHTPVVAVPLDKATTTVSDTVRTQGEHLTDKVAEVVKERVFKTGSERPERVVVSAEVDYTDR